MELQMEKEAKRKEKIEMVQLLYSERHSVTQIAKIIHLDPHTIRKYINGSSTDLCKNHGWKTKLSKYDIYYDDICELFKNGAPKYRIFSRLISKGCDIKRSNFRYYYAGRFTDREINSHPNQIKRTFISNIDVFKFIWMNEPLPEEVKKIVFVKYLKLQDVIHCVNCFRTIFISKSREAPDEFIEIYSKSEITQFASFAYRLQNDYEAVKNAVIYPYSNGFVEDSNNRLKMIKRTKYGRANLPLLSAKVCGSH